MSALSDAIDQLHAVDAGELCDQALRESIGELTTAINRLNAAVLIRLEKLDRRGVVSSEFGSTAAWLRETHNVSATVAHRQVHLARDLADTMPVMVAALAEGAVSVEHAQIAAGLRKDISDDQMRRADPALTKAARTKSPAELRGWVTAARHSLAPDRVVRDEREAWEERELHLATTFRGIGVGSWTLDPASQELIATAIHTASKPVQDDDRTPRQRRADALLTLARFFLDQHGTDRSEKRVAPHITIHVPLETLLGLPGAPTAPTDYGQQLSGEAARRIACDAAISRIITGPQSEILDAGRESRCFTTAARRAIAARDHGCIWPGCTAPPAWCDAHHIIHWADGGPSDAGNAALLCGHHHDRVHHHRHATVISPDGTRTIHPERNSADIHGWLIDRRVTIHQTDITDALTLARAGP